jgi:hypothetical protein
MATDAEACKDAEADEATDNETCGNPTDSDTRGAAMDANTPTEANRDGASDTETGGKAIDADI